MSESSQGFSEILAQSPCGQYYVNAYMRYFASELFLTTRGLQHEATPTNCARACGKMSVSRTFAFVA